MNCSSGISLIFSPFKFIFSLKYKTDKQRVTPKELAELGIVMKSNDSITLESEYEKVKKIDIDNWVQIRGPRPWEEDFGENEK